MRRKRPKPYPSEWPRRLGFISPLGLEIAAGTGGLETFHFRAVTSVKEGTSPPPEEVEGEYGILKKHPVYREKLIYEQTTTLDPLSNERVLVTQKELLEEITNSLSHINYVGEFPDIIIKERGIIEKIPSVGLSEAPELAQASEEYISYQSSVGNSTRKFLKTMPDLRGAIKNPYYLTRGELFDRGLIPKKSHPILKKMRSVIRTDATMTDRTGWGELREEGIEAIENALFGRKWPWDLGMPIRSVGEIDKTRFHWQFYRLSKRDFNIVL